MKKQLSIILVEVRKLIKLARINQGDNIYLGVDLFKLKYALKAQNLSNEYISEIFKHEIKKKIGVNGRLLIPVFCFKSLKKKFFDFEKSVSDTGKFGGCLIKNNFNNRTAHPFYSFLFFGKKNDPILDINNSISEDYLWNYILNNHFKLLTFGYHYVRSFSIVHYIEKIRRVDYRLNKSFHILFKKKKLKFFKKIFFFARKNNICYYSSITKYCDKFFFKKKLFKIYQFNYLNVCSLNLNKACNFLLNLNKKEFSKYVTYIPNSKKNNLHVSKVLNKKNIHFLENFYKKIN